MVLVLPVVDWAGIDSPVSVCLVTASWGLGKVVLVLPVVDWAGIDSQISICLVTAEWGLGKVVLVLLQLYLPYQLEQWQTGCATHLQ